jgi:tetratricopeptide (TPR) repeat protein
VFLGQYKESLKYFKKWLEKSKTQSEGSLFGMHRIGWAYWKNGYKEEAEYYFNEQINYSNRMKELGRVYGNNARIYYDLAGVYAFMGEKEKAYENLRSYNNQIQIELLWGVSNIRHDPLFDSLRDEPEFQQIVMDLEAKYQAEHERVRKWLEEQGML